MSYGFWTCAINKPWYYKKTYLQINNIHSKWW